MTRNRALLSMMLLAACSSSKGDQATTTSMDHANGVQAASNEDTGGTGTRMSLDEGKLGKADGKPADMADPPPPPSPTATPPKSMSRADAVAAARESGVMGSGKGIGYGTGGGEGYMPAQQVDAHVAAGEWDDNANYRDFVKWVKDTQGLDISNRQFLVVTDSHDKPVPDCKISISDGQTQASTSLVTMASGRAILFPKAVGLSAGKLTATASCGQSKDVVATIDASRADGVTRFQLASERSLSARRTVDLAFVLDTTGSMSEEIDAVKSTIRAVATQLQNDQTDVRIGLIEYKDRGDGQVTRAFPFSSDLKAFGTSVDGLHAGGGGDYPEDMQAGIQSAMDDLQWRSDAVSRIVVVIADAPPHLDYQNERMYTDSARKASQQGIKLFTVAASGMDGLGQRVMRQMSQYTGATNLFVLRGGAGPQSVGGGDPKSSCGTTHENYSSGNLDALIVRKVKQELASVDGDAMAIAGLGQDENAKPCDKRIVATIAQ